MESFVKIGFTQISLAALPRGVCCSPPAPMARMPIDAITSFFFKHIIVSVQFHVSETGLQFVPSLKIINRFLARKSNPPRHNKSRSNTRRLKKFIQFWSGSNNMNTEIELKTNEHYITDHIKLFLHLNMSRLIRKGRFCGPDCTAQFL